jgi:hypothetical protein
MKRHIATPVVAAAVAAGLLVTAACSGDGGSSDDGIATAGTGDNTQPGDDDPEPDGDEADGEPEGDAIDRPVIELPDDMVNVFEDTETGDQVKDAIIADVVRRIESLDLAFAEGDPEHEVLGFYSIEDAYVSAGRFVQDSADRDLSWGGTAVYYDFVVDNAERRATEPLVGYCTDISQLFDKDMNTGELLPKPDGVQNFQYTEVAVRESESGVWQVFSVLPSTDEGDQACER